MLTWKELIQVFTPTVLFSTLIPTFSGIYTRISKSLTNFENHRTDAGFENALTQKIFVLNFFTGYMSLFLTAYVYGTILSTPTDESLLEITLFHNSMYSKLYYPLPSTKPKISLPSPLPSTRTVSRNNSSTLR